jgi:hypothetical protein
MKRFVFAFLGLCAFSLSAMSQDIKPIRVQVEYNNGLKLNAEFVVPVGYDAFVAPGLSLGAITNNDFEVTLEARIYPFSPMGTGFFAAIAGIYTQSFTNVITTTLDSIHIGLGYRLIAFRVLTGIIGGGVSIPNDSGQQTAIYEQVGIGVAL